MSSWRLLSDERTLISRETGSSQREPRQEGRRVDFHSDREPSGRNRKKIEDYENDILRVCSGFGAVGVHTLLLVKS